MTKITMLFAAIALCLGLSLNSASAQPDPEEMVNMQIERFQPVMNLNAEQTATFKAILLDQTKKMSEAFEAAGGDFESMGEKMQTLDKEVNEKVKAAFGQEITDKYIAEKTKMMEEMMQF